MASFADEVKKFEELVKFTMILNNMRKKDKKKYYKFLDELVLTLNDWNVRVGLKSEEAVNKEKARRMGL
jgi:hypothetical protein